MLNDLKDLTNFQGFYTLYNVKVGINRYLDIYILITEPPKDDFAVKVIEAWDRKYCPTSSFGQ
jgi:hypothetical protein